MPESECSILIGRLTELWKERHDWEAQANYIKAMYTNYEDIPDYQISISEIARIREAETVINEQMITPCAEQAERDRIEWEVMPMVAGEILKALFRYRAAPPAPPTLEPTPYIPFAVIIGIMVVGGVILML